MKRVVFDCETDGFLSKLTKIHCLVLRDADDYGNVLSCTNADRRYPTIKQGLEVLAQADEIIGHNILEFDIPALQKVYPDWKPKDGAKVLDTLLFTRILWPEIKDGDFARVKLGKMPGSCLIRPHSLESWGYRLGLQKGTYGKGTDWQTWEQEMQDYCELDTAVNWRLWERIKAKNLDPRCIQLEHEVRALCTRITKNGFPFDRKLAQEVLAKVMADKAVIDRQLQAMFPPLERRSIFVPKVNNKTRGYQKGVPFERVKVEPFNPGSRQQIAERLKDKYGWEPEKFTEGGDAQLNEDVLDALPHPEARLLTQGLLLDKRAGSLEGKQGWLTLQVDGKIHGEYVTCGAVTGRATHKNPNIAQVTKNCPRYGKVFRQMFTVPPGWLLVGADMSGLELRCLAAYLAPFDDGRYVHEVTQGDVHTANQIAAGLATRDQAKTFIYAFLYGAGEWKLGHIVDPTATDDVKIKLGGELKNRFLANTPGLRAFRNAVSDRVATRGYLVGVDGRPLTIRKKHAAVNTLLQSAGAVLCKRWIVATEQRLIAEGLRHGWDGDYAVLAWVHDELQTATPSQALADRVARVAVEETTKAGEYFNFGCPLTGEVKIGTNWSATH